MSPFAIVGFSALAVVVVGWLWVSFTEPGPRRAVVEWLAASGLYGALVSLFASLAQRAWREDSTVALVGFGFLVLLFGSGLLVSLANTLLSLRGGGGGKQQSATN